MMLAVTDCDGCSTIACTDDIDSIPRNDIINTVNKMTEYYS